MILFDQISELMTLAPVAEKSGRQILEKDLGLVKNAALVVEGGRLAWVGPRSKLPRSLIKKIRQEVSCKKSVVVPGFVESHTHLVFGGDRSAEFELRNQGVSYQEIAAQGGGILSTMRATRKMKTPELLQLAQARVDEFSRQGVTTLEAKSGYCLDEKNELRVLALHKELRGPRIVSTFLGAHALPPEFDSHAEYLEFLSGLLPKIAKKKLASRVDVFVERGFFSVELAEEYLLKAREMGLEVAVHGDQLTLSGGTSLAVRIGARSVDHAICVGQNEIQQLADSSVTAVLLPAADLYMKCDYPPARKMIDAGVRVALATDFNPGSSPTQDLSLVGVLARLQMKMTLPEVWAAWTYNGAAALGLESELGHLSVGTWADFSICDQSWDQFFYSVGKHPIGRVYRSGRSL